MVVQGRTVFASSVFRLIVITCALFFLLFFFRVSNKFLTTDTFFLCYASGFGVGALAPSFYSGFLGVSDFASGFVHKCCFFRLFVLSVNVRPREKFCSNQFASFLHLSLQNFEWEILVDWSSVFCKCVVCLLEALELLNLAAHDLA